MTIDEYIKSKKRFRLMPFATVYATITELISDGFIEENAFGKGGVSNVAMSQSKPERTFSGGLYGESYFRSDR